MSKEKTFSIGCNGRGVQLSSLDHPVKQEELSIREQFRLVKEAGVFDYFDRLPLRSNLGEYLQAIDDFQLPVLTSSWFYTLGDEADDAALLDNLKICSEVGSKVHNIMTFTHDNQGLTLTDSQIIDHYIRAYEFGHGLGVEPSFELHVNMWTEDFRRIEPIALKLREQGVPFNFTLDYSHVIFKINNPQELDISGVRREVESLEMKLDPFEAGSLCEQWLDLNIVKWTQLRVVAPNQPKNLWYQNESGEFARGIQYPITRPAIGEWHSEWNAFLTEPSKEAIRKALRYHITHPDSPLEYITTEMINLPDYGAAAKYNLFEQNIEAARFIRRAWQETQALYKAGLLA
ncbi:xylose isomerase [Pseudomonas sp. VI4.1]|uniref:xylose isomerase n=1 Tax=Pseudomonas sp. VI4.1 TaxID=1941346 RepID=UPI0009D5B109|nr:xylose isomerase [Pseudomonas sp. VI4.1]OPK10194.1 xylose isomerase [Pseudomonas sp. VI4.1]